MSPFDQEWERCSPWVQAALDHAGNLFTLEDVKKAVIKGEAIFLPGLEAAVIAEIRVYPQKRIYNCWLAGGNLEELKLAFAPAIRRYAKRAGCDAITIQGRPGWQRVFNMRQKGVVLTEEVAK
jgi:hypothetical protein